MDYKIPLSKPYLDKKDFLMLKKCFDSSWISSKSYFIEEFEKKFAQKISQTKYAVALNSGTSALFLALKVLEIGPGDEVILPSFTMVATINAILWVGAKPVLIDSQSKKNWNINIFKIEEQITKNTKAIIPVHIYGYVCEMDKILSIAKKYKLFVIEDAAEAIGSTYNNKIAGSFGDISCFSLYSNKIITTGNGGILATNSKKIYQKVKRLSFFDFNPKKHFYHHQIGYNLVMTGLQASLGISQINKFSKLLKKRKQIFKWYYQFLKQNKKIFFIKPSNQNQPNYWFPVIVFKLKKDKLKIKTILKKNLIETREAFIPIHKQPVFKNLFIKKNYPIADFFSNHSLLLSSFYQLTKNEVYNISQIINKNL
ncbi:MAG: GDP-perosamine synthase RfbE/PerA [Candidatus Microgenomates bacterium]